MKKLLYALLLMPQLAFSQTVLEVCQTAHTVDYLHGNNARATILNAGSLFWDGSEGGFFSPFTNADDPVSTYFVQGLWLGATAPDGSLRVAAAKYGLNSNNVDYWPGPLDENGATDLEFCTNWNRIWSVRRPDILAHIADYQDNQFIDHALPSILEWPGRGNPYFENRLGFPLPNSPQGLAPFFDNNGDGIYDPMKGDYPRLENTERLPEHLMWCVFNDEGGGKPHGETDGLPLKVEVQLTAWAFNCEGNPLLSNTIFTSHKIINRGQTSLDSMYVGFFNDVDLGCYLDDGIGSNPSLDSYFSYNLASLDSIANCGGFPFNEIEEAVASTTFLDQPLHHFLVLGMPCTEPSFWSEGYYNILQGNTQFGNLTYGEDGCNPANPPTNFAFPGDPNNPSEWSMATLQLEPAQHTSVASTKAGNLPPGGVFVLTAAHATHKYEGLSALQNVSKMYLDIGLLRAYYNQGFSGSCLQPSCQTDCVWPGDTNADGIANHCDLLPIGLNFDKDGPDRTPFYLWSPLSATNWGGASLGSSDNKHVDADGSGTLDEVDFKMTRLHYNYKVPGYEAPPDVYEVGDELYFEPAGTASFENIAPGASFFVRVKLAEVPDLFGLAFQVEYDERYVEFTPNFSNFYFAGNDQMRFGSNGIGDGPIAELDFAKVRTSPDSTIQAGTFVTLNIKALTDFDQNLPAGNTALRIKNIKAVRSDGSEIHLGAQVQYLTFQGLSTGIDEPKQPTVTLFPNPATSQLTVSSPGQVFQEIAIYDVAGRRVYFDGQKKEGTVSVDLEGICEGIYFLKMHMNGYYLTKKFVVVSP